MRTQIGAVLLAILLGMGWGETLWGADAAPTKAAVKETDKSTALRKKAAPRKKPKVQKFVGNITAVDAKSGTVSVKGSAGEMQFAAQNAARDALERLSVGDRVRVQYTEKDKKLLASSVRRLKLPQTKGKSPGTAAKSKSTEQPKSAKEKAK